MQQTLFHVSSSVPRRFVVASVVLLGVLVALLATSPSLRTNVNDLLLIAPTTTSDPPVMSPSEVAARASFDVLWPAFLPTSTHYVGGDVGPAGSHGSGTGIEKGSYASFSWIGGGRDDSSPAIRLIEATGRYPVPRGQSIQVRGQSGVLMKTGSQALPEGNNAVFTIVWHENGLTLSVHGNGLSEAQVQQVAESLQPLNRPTTIPFLDATAQQIDGSRAVVGSPRDFPIPSVNHFGDLKVYLVRTELGFVAVIDDDPHRHHPTAWNAAAQYFISPAHGEEYDWEGNCIGGPCPRGLDRYAVKIDGGQIVVDLSRRLPGRPIGDHLQGTPSPHLPFVPW